MFHFVGKSSELLPKVNTRLRLLSLFVLVLVSLCMGCAIPLNVPYVDVALKQPENSAKTSIRVAVIIPDEKYIMKKTGSEGGLVSVYTVPFGKILKKASSEILPGFFEEVEIVNIKPAPENTDLLFIPKINDFDIRYERPSAFNFNVMARVSLDVTIANSNGAQIWKKTIVSPWKSKTHNGLSQKKYVIAHAIAITEATAVAIKDAVRGMFMSRVFKYYLAGKDVQQMKSKDKTFKLPPLRSDTFYDIDGPKQKRKEMAVFPTHSATALSTPKPTLPSTTSSQISAAQRWAVVIGVSSYKDTRISSLRYASADAKAFYEWLISPTGGKYAPSNVNCLLDKNATAKNIKNALFVWLKQAIREDIITIFFACHGSPESPDSLNNLFLLPYDAKYDEIATSGFPMWDLETALKRFIKAKKVVIIADACHSGGIGQSFDIARRANRGIKVNPISSELQSLSKVGDGVCVISASDEKQFSQESQNWGGGHGVFTYFLLKGLKGEADYSNDQRVTLGELIPYLSEQVRRTTKSAQCPTVAGKFDPALTIGK